MDRVGEWFTIIGDTFTAGIDRVGEWFIIIGDAFAAGIDRIGEWFIDIKDGIVDSFKKLGELLNNFKDAVKGWFTSVIDGIADIFDFCKNLVKNLVKGFLDLLKSVFIPSDDFFTTKFTELKNKLSNRFGFGVYGEMIEALKGYVSGSVNFKGYIDVSMWVKGGNLGTVQNFIRGFFYPLILLANVRFVTWLIRGSSSMSAGKGDK